MEHLELLRLLRLFERADLHALHFPHEELFQEGLLDFVRTQSLVHHGGDLLDLLDKVGRAASELLYLVADSYEIK